MIQNVIDVVEFQTTSQSLFSKQTYYTIKGSDKEGNFEVHRRFKDFVALRNLLAIQWPGCYVPSLPGKKLFNGNDAKTINDRKKFLHAFCQKLSLLPHLFQTEEVSQIFLRSKDEKVYKKLESIKSPSTQDLLVKYQTIFADILDVVIEASTLKEIDNFADQVRNYSIKLKNIKKIIKDSVQSGRNYNSCLEEIIKTRLINFENSFVFQFVNSDASLLIFNRIKQELVDTYQEKQVFTQNNIEILLDLIRLESKDCKIVLKQISDKINLENKVKNLENKIIESEKQLEKLNQGKVSFKNLIKQKSPEDAKKEVEQEIADIVKELKYLSELIVLINKILALKERTRYENDKNQQFKEIMEVLQQMELESIKIESQYWGFILNETNQLINKTQYQQQQQIECQTNVE
ncbi:unnamed protein product (macronuclear) [Paramecium tetraurelia]|uniref:PX domain-containing protein n=1 Tax=Paramecium tetraurelia TaxID=5888 RepID=A0DZP5_PARTE|nr:uncharacterized protein GSPATT00021680001 [Paramecium tetraurelia]CAK88512.1 unnamed protein product [Paramecium tetraurelia]|eukprot:XP_001455909.1 hypothetical protein (macronuclear) [Paramecium tetraurelia strain d4-2]